MRKFFTWISPVFLAGLLLCSALVGFLFAANYFLPSAERTYNQRLEKRIAAGDKKIPLQELTDFEWDRVCYIKSLSREGSYGTNLDELLGFKYRGSIPSQSCDTYSYNILAFFTYGRSAQIIKMRRCSPKVGKEIQPITDSHMCFSKDVYFQVYAYEFRNKTFNNITFVGEN